MLGKTSKVILAVILLIGAGLRMYNFWDFSLSNDELSALARLDFSSFKSLIMNGVRIDGHPPAAQVLLWVITSWFGNGVFAVRLPFVIAGILSVYFMYRVARDWVSTTSGLLSAAAFATLAFPLLYSRIARPYALGMLFTLMAAAFWVRIVKNKYTKTDIVWFSVSLALCAYAHYFAALTAGVVAFSGLFVVKKQALKHYLIALAVGLLLFLPYTPIFLHQLSLGGVGQWLGPPKNDWIWHHLNYAFNESLITQIAIIMVAILGFVLGKPKKIWFQSALPLLLFTAPFVVGFLYSQHINPVLQNSTLVFSFPFLLVFLFSGWSDDSQPFSHSVTLILLAVVLWSTTIEKRFYKTNYFGVFKELAQHINEWKNELQTPPLLIGDFNFPFYIDYYANQLDSTRFDLYRTTNDTGLATLKSMVDTASQSHLIYAWSTVNQGPEVEAIIRERFPIEVERATYFNSESVLFERGTKANADEVFKFEKTSSWNFDPKAADTLHNGRQAVFVSESSPYGPTFQVPLSALIKKGIATINVRVECSTNIDVNKLEMVYEQVNEAGGYAWQSDLFERQFRHGSPSWGHFCYSLKPEQSSADVLKIYPWLPLGEPVFIYSMEIFYSP